MPLVEGTTLSVRFEKARRILIDLFPKRARPGKTYTAFSEAWMRHSNALLAMTQERLCQAVQAVAQQGGCWKIGNFIPLAVDGTRVEAPRTQANQDGLGCCGRDSLNPQAWMTLMIHLGTGIPWAFTVDRGDSAERNHLRQLLGCLPALALLIADAGFCGYELWLLMMRLNQPFLIRVGANVRLIEGLDDQGVEHWQPRNSDRVFLWPKQGRDRNPPIELRLIMLTDGKTTIYLVTNVLDERMLTGEQAAQYYKLRWGIELWFRSMKQTLELSKLHSHAPQQAKLELSWAAVSQTLLGLMHVQGLIAQGVAPGYASCKGALKVVREAMDTPAKRRKRKGNLIKALGRAHKDTYKRKGFKSVRPYPKKKKTYTSAGAPNRLNATALDIAQFKDWIHTRPKLALTA